MTSNLPPGLQGPAKEVLAGGHLKYDSFEWMPFENTKLFTNVFIWDEKAGKILLGLKKRGFGMGLYNGFGGKVEPGETSVEGAARELKEEVGLVAELIPSGTLLCYLEGTPYAHYIEIFSSDVFQGEPTESEEMQPEWFSIPSEYCTRSDNLPKLAPIPFDRMWPDDRFWMPLLLSRRRFIGRVDLKKTTPTSKESKMVKWWFGTIESCE